MQAQRCSCDALPAVRRWILVFAWIGMTCAGCSSTKSAQILPRRADGHVDLQGNWFLSNLTPLERPATFHALVISEAEAARMTASVAAARRNQPTGGPTEAFDEHRAMEPIRGQWRASVIVEPSDGRIPGNALFKSKLSHHRATSNTLADGPEQRPPPERCLTSPAATPPMLSVPTLNLHQIVQTADSVVIHSEWNHEARIVRLNAPHVPPSISSWLGDSIGWWDGDTLVVETTRFSASSELRATAGILYFVSPSTVVTERFTRVSTEELQYEFTVKDPTLYVSAWRGENQLKRSEESLLEFACHEGNYAIQFVLQGARAADVLR